MPSLAMPTRPLLAALALALSPAVAHACSCTAPAPLAQRYAKAPVVFLGRVVDTALVRPWWRGGDRPMRMHVVVALKGARSGRTISVDNAAASSCIWAAPRGASAVVFAHPVRGGAVATGFCVGNVPLACAAPVFRLAGVRPPAGAGDCPSPRYPLDRRRPTR